ncbi:MAG: hypothetical protein WCX95_04635 [Candidatus Gracilibacteria bacterium]
MANGEGGKDRVPIVLDVPEDVRMHLRRGVFMTIGELPLGSPDSSISVLERDLGRVIAFVRSQIPDVEIIEQDGTRTLRKEKEPIPEPSPATPDVFEEDEWTSADEARGLYGHHGQWGEIREQINLAREMASLVNKPSKGRKWPKFRISVSASGFHYRGESISLNGKSGKIKTAKELRAWRAVVNKMKRS